MMEKCQARLTREVMEGMGKWDDGIPSGGRKILYRTTPHDRVGGQGKVSTSWKRYHLNQTGLEFNNFAF